MGKETAFSSIKRIFGEYTFDFKFQIGKRDDNKDIIVQPIYKNCIKRIKN